MPIETNFASGDEFEFYAEKFDDDGVYLNLRGDGVEFKASYRSVTLRIPLAVWEVIRHAGGDSFDLIEKTDAELLERVEREVEERIIIYKKLKQNGNNKYSIARQASPVFGSIQGSRERQIERGLDYYRKERARQLEVLEQVQKIRLKNEEKQRGITGVKSDMEKES